VTLPPSKIPPRPLTKPDPIRTPAHGTRSTRSGQDLGAPPAAPPAPPAPAAPSQAPAAKPSGTAVAKPTPPRAARPEATRSKTLLPSPAAGRTVPKAVAPAPKPPTPVAFPPPELSDRCEALIARYPARVAALIPILHLAQRHYDGWISPEVEAGIARYLGCSDQHVRGVVTFYTMFNRRPIGRLHVQICRTLSCWLRGAGDLTRLCREKTGLSPGETDAQRRVTVQEVECIGLCEVAPAIFLNDTAHGNVTPAFLTRVLDEAR
jgi:NADH-quinone oxidoreductase subunit E